MMGDKKAGSMISPWANYKRLSELCYSDKKQEKDFLDNPEKFLNENGLALDVGIAKEAIEIQAQEIQAPGFKTARTNYYINLSKQVNEKIRADLHDRINADNLLDQRFKAWYLRQTNSGLYRSIHVRSEDSKSHLFFIPVCFELTTGCSGGCPFCCLDPEGLKDIFSYSDENATLWQNILIRTKEIIGNFGFGGCYFGTEPFDNPDYERFIKDYYHVFGYYPQTTTVKAVDDIQRTKDLLHMLGEEHLKRAAVRFSVISKRQLERIYKAFAPEELAYINLVLNNPESQASYSLTGRAVNLREKLPDKKMLTNFTPSCVVGFVVNMPQRSVRLIAPRNNSEVGMRVYDTMTFTDEASYQDVIYKLIDKWMMREIPQDKKLYTYDISFEKIGDYLKIQGDNIYRKVSVSERVYQILIRTLEGCTLEKAFEEFSVTPYERKSSIELMQFLYDNGYIDIA